MAINSGDIFAVGPDRITGAVMYAPLGTAMPVGVNASVSSFTECGYIDETGVKFAQTQNWIQARDWNGDIARSFLSTFDSILSFVFMETNVNSVNQFFGIAQVTATAPTGSTGNAMAVAVNSQEPTRQAYVINAKDGAKKLRICLPNAQVTKRGDMMLSRKAAMTWAVDVTAYPDSLGNNAYLYTDDGLIIGTSIPSISSVSPSAQGAGSIVNINGSGFTGASAVTFGGTNASSYRVESDNLIAATLPAGSAGTTPVVVTNSTGTSTAYSYTRAV